MEMEKKNLAIIILAVVLAASGIGNVVLAITGGFFELEAEKGVTFRTAETATPYTLDPVDAWDGASNQIIDQCVEGLFTYAWDRWDLSYPHLPNLATGYSWTPDAMELTITLRTDVIFHDGTRFNATCVEWNFLRMDYWFNLTGLLPSGAIPGYPEYIYHFPDGVEPLWESHHVVNQTVFVINMSSPYTPLVDLLCYTASGMVSPTSHNWDWKAPFDTAFKKGPVGTGPYVFDYYKISKEARFHRWDRWWRTNPYIEKLVFVYLDDTTAAATATIAGDYDWMEGCPVDSRQLAIDSPVVEYVPWSMDTGQTAWCYCYFEFNGVHVPYEVRKALNMAYNYTYVIEEMYDNTFIRPETPVPLGMPGHDPTVKGVENNITAARMEMINYDPGNFSALGLTDDAAWIAKAASWGSGDLPYYLKQWCRLESTGDRNRFDVMEEWFALIGIKIVEEYATWSEFIANFKANPNWCDLWLACWCPDYISALNMLAPIIHPASLMAHGQFDDALLNTWMAEAGSTTDPLVYDQKIKDIQHRFMEDIIPHIPFSYDYLDYLIGAGWLGCDYQAARNIHFYTIYREV
jgi:ABC-type transport system substrate-binding protein